MSANLYDILNVDETASVDEIRGAWKAAVADLDPTDRRFRAFNDAAAVLLDADKRAAYDAELAAARDADEPAGAPVVLTKHAPDDAADDAADDAEGEARGQDEAVPTRAAPAREPAATTKQQAEPAGPPGWALGAAGVAAVVSLVLAVVLLLQPGGKLFSDDSPAEVAAANQRFQESARSVESAAERLVGEVFSYNYETMDADLERVQQHVTPELGAKQAKGWPDIAKDAADQKLVVQARAEAVALTRLSRDGRNATVMVFLVQESTRNEVRQTPLRMWVSLAMVRESGSSQSWLVDDVCVDSNCDRPG
ncbi:Mce-associated membrane protein [Nocardioides sp. J9]|uniref:DnaJ domain-containing protein n=1 Tax=Nocardioides sp. J9 TaxID=935844 RepID=UPI0011A57730|nr:DnaJ domain-containing protein [Nocardioides sp. J9]TWH01997.1 Mce-associated membrane protein [Nocardioides sp. J9]